MNATPVSKDQADREAIRMLVADIGYQDTATRSGIPANTLYQWARRYGWNTPIPHKQKTVRSVRSVADSHAEALAEMESETRISLARASRRMAKDCEELPAREANTALTVAKTASLVHGWGNEKGQAGFSLNVLNLGQLQIGVKSYSTDDPTP